MAKLVIADGGASGYLMENNLPATVLATTMDPDIIKLDLILSGDNKVIVFGSPYLETATNVVELFPDRQREDGHYYALDFDLATIRTLTLKDPKNRYPAELQSGFSISTLEEELTVLRTLEKSLNKSITIAVYLEKPWLHRKEGTDLISPVLAILQKFGYGTGAENTYLLSYDYNELQRIKKELLPEKQMQLKLVQLIDRSEGQESMIEEYGKWVPYNYELLFFNTGLRALSKAVIAIGLPKDMLVDSEKNLRHERFIINAHRLGTQIFTFGIHKDTEDRLPFVRNFEEELEFFYFTVGVDGIFTDFCLDASNYLKERAKTPLSPLEEMGQPDPPTRANDPLQLTTSAPFEMEN